MYLKFSKVRDVKTPNRANKGADAGIDFFVPYDTHRIVLNPGESRLIPSGIKVEVPQNYALILFNKGGVASKKKLVIGACVVDHGYSGEIHLDLHNIGTETQTIEPGDKITQAILLPIIVPELIEVDQENLYQDISCLSDRGTGMTGSTGVK